MKRVLICVMTAMLVSACGIKPGNVRAPEGSVDVYPRSYPAPEAGDKTAR